MQEVAGSNPAGSTRRQNVAKVTLEGLPVRKVAVLRLKELGEGVWEEERYKEEEDDRNPSGSLGRERQLNTHN